MTKNQVQHFGNFYGCKILRLEFSESQFGEKQNKARIQVFMKILCPVRDTHKEAYHLWPALPNEENPTSSVFPMV